MAVESSLLPIPELENTVKRELVSLLELALCNIVLEEGHDLGVALQIFDLLLVLRVCIKVGFLEIATAAGVVLRVHPLLLQFVYPYEIELANGFHYFVEILPEEAELKYHLLQVQILAYLASKVRLQEKRLKSMPAG